jgi:hypothetical protein
MTLRTLLLVLISGVAAAALPGAPAVGPGNGDGHREHARHGLHGMLLFGGADDLLASHLPLFRVPHDRQIVLALRVRDASAAAALRGELERANEIHTLVPEPFDLNRMNPSRRPR